MSRLQGLDGLSEFGLSLVAVDFAALSTGVKKLCYLICILDFD